MFNNETKITIETTMEEFNSMRSNDVKARAFDVIRERFRAMDKYGDDELILIVNAREIIHEAYLEEIDE